MTKRYRVQLYWPGRDTPLSSLAEEFWKFANALGQIDPNLARMRPFTRDGELLQPLTGPQHAEALLTHWEVRWCTGDVERVSYKPGLALDRIAEPPVSCELTTGIPPLGMEGIWVPNRLEVLVRTDAADELVRPEILLGILHAGVRVFAPDWGFAALDGDPVPPRALFSKGAPVAAWITYLSRAHPVEHVTVGESAAVYSVGDLGYLVIAHPELPTRGSISQRAAVKSVADALRAAGVTH